MSYIHSNGVMFRPIRSTRELLPNEIPQVIIDGDEVYMFATPTDGAGVKETIQQTIGV